MYNHFCFHLHIYHHLFQLQTSSFQQNLFGWRLIPMILKQYSPCSHAFHFHELFLVFNHLFVINGLVFFLKNMFFRLPSSINDQTNEVLVGFFYKNSWYDIQYELFGEYHLLGTTFSNLFRIIWNFQSCQWYLDAFNLPFILSS